MSISQWHMHRMGLVDFWCYDNDEMYFSDGHMLLRGSNGSGKSVTMQSFIPLLLDGNRSSERLDPFGTRSRKMDSYLIDENSQRDERIGYLYLEFKRSDSELYKTIGMGMRARSGKPLDVWYFVIEDNRRVNIDFSLMNHRLTLSRKQLENILGDQVITSQKEYMRRVNDALFGYSHIDDYKDMIDLLLQLRSPKLSNSLSPSKINEILANSLQPLSEEDLRPMSDAITSMDNLQDELENLNVSLTAAKKIAQAYQIYNQAMLVDKWKKYQRENDAYQTIIKDIQNKEKEIAQLQSEYQQFKDNIAQKQIQKEILMNERNLLSNPQIERLHEEYISLKNHIQELSQQISQKQNQCDIKDDKMIDLQNDIDKYETQIYQAQKKHSEAMDMLDEIYESFPFSEHVALKETLLQQKSFDFQYTRQRLKEELKHTQNTLSLYDQYERKQHQIQDIENEMIRFHDQMQHVQDELEEVQQLFSQCVEEYQEYFYKYNQDNQVLKLTDHTLTKMVQLLNDYEVTNDYHQIYSLVHQQYIQQYEAFTKEKGVLQLQLQQYLQQYDELNEDYQLWINKKDFEPIRDELTIKSRHYLDEHHIAYKPFYQLIDFTDDVREDQRNQIEELLLQMSLLDAIVVEKQYQQQISQCYECGHDYYLWTHHSIDTLETIDIDSSFGTQQFVSLLEQLGIENQKDILIQDTYFQMGVLEGTIDQGQESLYIGYQKRQLLRQQKIDELSLQIEQVKSYIENKEKNIHEIEQNIPLLKKEMEAFKDEEEIKDCYQAITQCQKDIQYYQNKIDQLFLQKEQQVKKLQTLYLELQKECQHLFVDMSKEALLSHQESIEDYEVHMENLKDALLQESHYQKLLDIEQEKLSELQEDTDQLKYEISSFDHQIQIDEGKAQTIQKQLDEQGYTDQQKKLEHIEQQIKNLDIEINDHTIKSSKIEERQSYNQNILEQLSSQAHQQKDVKEHYYDLLIQEVQYGFILSQNDSLEKNLKTLNQNTHINKSISDYLGSLQSIFFEQASYLSQYHLTYEVDALCYEVDDVSGHFLIKANHQGKKIPFMDLLDILQQRIETQKLLIVEEDRHIFEEILVNTIGRKIRNRIQSSKRWVEKMERYMRDMNTSSGLQLGLKWNSKKALDDDELDTHQLVELLEKDYRVLKESDRQKISQHFRSKIEKARHLSLEDSTTASFHQMMRDVMDYRQWFEFTLYAKKTNENRKELTNRLFYSYSGGEKAIAMYVPLFSAVAAKFEGAREDAPHLIALDEAFAGVDENNIDNMFALISKFQFDYIMNSQVLWGDYPSCHSLAIYELFRPNNAPFVTKVAYHWNGHVKKVKMQ